MEVEVEVGREGKGSGEQHPLVDDARNGDNIGSRRSGNAIKKRRKNGRALQKSENVERAAHHRIRAQL